MTLEVSTEVAARKKINAFNFGRKQEKEKVRNLYAYKMWGGGGLNAEE